MGAPAEEFGPYLVYEQIGLGGMATVHRAETTGIAGFTKQVALKRMLPNVAADANLVKSFIREARLASHLRHANVAQTFDLGKVGETYFIAMELVPGHNLREILKHCSAVVGNMPLHIAMNIVNQICDALDYAHDLCDDSGQPLGIIHRDVSPANIIVSEGGVVKLIDFGIAKASARGMNTMSGTIKGKFGYMAPEYLMGSIDARADLFAVGVIAHELLSNRPLFQGKDDMDTLYRVKDMPILPPSRFNAKVPPELDSIVMTALDRDPERRWQRAHALAIALATETKRLGLSASNTQVIEWIEWAFHQRKGQFDEESAPQISISPGTVELPRSAPPRDVVPDEFSNQSDSLETLIKPSALGDDTRKTPGTAPADDWNAGADSTTPSTESIDKRLGEATRLLRPSNQLRAQTPVNPLVDTLRDGDPRPSRNVVQRNTPAPVRVETPLEEKATFLVPKSDPFSDGPDAIRTVAPPGRAGDPRVQNLIERAQTMLAPPNEPAPRPTPPPLAGGPHMQRTLIADPNAEPAPRPSRPSQAPSHNAGAFIVAAPGLPATPLPPAPVRSLPLPATPLPSAGLASPASPPIVRTLAGQGQIVPAPNTPRGGASVPPPLAPAPTSPVLSGQRTKVHIPRGGIDRNLLDDSVLEPAEGTAYQTRVEQGKRGRAGNFLLAVLVLVAAGAAAAVVYFALPYFT